MQDAPEQIWAWVYNLPYNKHNGYRCWTPFKATFKPWVVHDWPGWKFWKSRTTEYYQNQTEYTRTDLCVTEAECQRRIDAAVAVEREACAGVVDKYTEKWRTELATAETYQEGHRWWLLVNNSYLIESAIRARGRNDRE